MNRKTYRVIFLFLLLLLVGFYFVSEIKEFWIKHIVHLGVMFFAGLTLVGLNKNQLPIKEKAKFKLNHILVILVGVIGLLGVSNFIPVLATKIAGIDNTGLLNRTSEINRVFAAILSLAIFEEILFRRILAQKLFNRLGLKKAVWISALIFGLTHIYTETGILSAFIGGASFAYIYLKTNNIYLSITAHLLYNITTYLLTPYFANIYTTINEYPIIISVLIVGSGLIYAMFWFLNIANIEKKTAEKNT
ncbi:type II CAAX endopeptidase family protein [Cellulophaga sp. F20128]|uniref:CPBP family intramembrane glutamic endopeptidase n=1 Tax=Cellulophaga sp. F20128 TaxID=2926413 RepID=UPI001FF4DF9B|nr:type II CAAX endopeptidase family protein [Cellulophaga sp. F20128]